MEIAIVVLSVACVVQAVIIGVAHLTVPYLWRQVHRLEDELAKLDEVVNEFLEAAGINERKK